MTRALAAIATALLCSAALASEPIPALEEDVPQVLPAASRAPLEARLAAMIARRNALRARVADHDSRCRLYSSNSPEAKSCPPAKIRLYADRDSYAADVKAFNWDLSQAIGSYRIQLEHRLREVDQGIRNDVAAMKQLGFDRREDDFKEWENLSADARDKLSVALAKFTLDEGAQVLQKGILSTLERTFKGFDPGAARRLAAEMERAGLGNTPSARKLREYALSAPSRAEINALAEEIYGEIKATVGLAEAGRKGEKLEVAKGLIDVFAHETVKKFPALAVGELAVWTTYSAAAQGVAAYQVVKLNNLTAEQLKGLAGIRCVNERHMAQRYELRVALAELNDDPPLSSPRPMRSKACGK